MKISKKIGLCAMPITVLLLILVSAITVSAGPVDTKHEKGIKTDDLSVGDIMAEGTPGAGDACYFNDVRFVTTAPHNGKTKWVSIKFDKQCRAVIKAKWEGALEDGPKDIIEPVLNFNKNKHSQIILEPQPLNTDGATIATAGTKTSQQRVYTYGIPGPLDVLTEQVGSITFSYDGTNAEKSSSWASFSGETWTSLLGWKWVVDDSETTSSEWGPSSIVWTTHRGDYHCDPASYGPCTWSNPDGYYHSLYTDEDGHADGTSHCTFWKSGNVVQGPNRDILQGCS
ncbi:MAG TPA: hypothetical protein VIO11_07365 [Candidatus Methanoperedens sp.]